ncbi:MAG: MFS transporter [Tenuifilaceae bacterium]|nr:MFS transporter [Tenuifilaceae bacterium]
MTKRPRLSFWQIWNMSFGFLGIQFGYALQNANVSRIFETLGANIDAIPILWIAAPVTGLIIQPIIGHMSDNTWGRLGRRRPFFLVGAILASAALIFMPNSPVLWVAAGMLWILDASINVSMEPFRAFVGDMLPSEQRTKGFAMQSFFIGTGAVIASALPYILTEWVGVANTAPEGQIPPSVKWSFYLGAIAFFGAVILTIIKTKEYSPEELKAFEEAEQAEVKQITGLESIVQHQEISGKFFLKQSFIWIALGVVLSLGVLYFTLDPKLYIVTIGIVAFGLIQLLVGLLKNAGKNEGGLVVVINDLFNMPKTMAQLAVVQFFSWFALFAMWIYTTAGVTSHIYDMKISQGELNQLKMEQQRLLAQSDSVETGFRFTVLDEEIQKIEKHFAKGKAEVAVPLRLVNLFLREGGESETTKEIHYQNAYQIDESLFNRFKVIVKEYNTGANWVGICFATYNGFAAVMAFLLVIIAKYTSRKITHAISLVAGGIGLISIFFVTNPTMLLVSMLGVGLAWASILSMPYAILAGSLPSNKMGTYMGIFNFFIVIPQILAASILGFFVGTVFGGEAIYSLILGGASMIFAALMVFFVTDRDDVVAHK